MARKCHKVPKSNATILADTIASPGRAFHAFIKPHYPCVGKTILGMFLKELPKYGDDYKVSHAELHGSGWLKATTFIRDGNNDAHTKGRLIIWLLSGEGWVFDAVPSYEVGRLHGFARKAAPVEELTSEELVDLLKRSLKACGMKGERNGNQLY